MPIIFTDVSKIQDTMHTPASVIEIVLAALLYYCIMLHALVLYRYYEWYLQYYILS